MRREDYAQAYNKDCAEQLWYSYFFKRLTENDR